MKGYYLFAPVEPECVAPNSGILKKVQSQFEVLKKYFDIELIVLPPVEYTGTISEKIIRRLPFTAGWRKWKYDGQFNDADFLYIRRVSQDSSFVRFLKKIRKNNPNIKIIYEIPTYPESKENHVTLSNFMFIIKDRVHHLEIGNLVDVITTFYQQKKIYGAPCIRLMNGFDFSKVELPNRKRNNTIHIISVATNAIWHGYDRMIEGIHQYYRSGGIENIVYHVVGLILPEYEKLIQKYQLEEHVILHGGMYGEELKMLYSQCFVGIDVLGGHRKDYPVSSSLKSREYCAYGLPIVTSSRIDFYGNLSKYQFLAPYDDSAIDIAQLVRWYHGIYDGADENIIGTMIRENAKSKCDMETSLLPLITWIRQ